jgi:hypothetical protein
MNELFSASETFSARTIRDSKKFNPWKPVLQNEKLFINISIVD